MEPGPLALALWPAGPLVGLAAVGGAMLLGFVWQRRRSNAAIVDVIWTLSLGGLALGYALAADGLLARRLLIAGMLLVWAARLGTHLIRDRLLEGVEEGRYKRLREWLGKRVSSGLLVFFLLQAVLAVLLSLALLPGLSSARPGLDAFDIAGLLLFLVALAGEALADHQLKQFKADEGNRGKVCERGLWAWSRHPNYFFQWLLWVAYVLPGLPAPLGLFGLLAPALMLFLVLRVTGIPPTEKQALESRGEAYRDYQRRVSPFLPLPPRESSPA